MPGRCSVVTAMVVNVLVFVVLGLGLEVFSSSLAMALPAVFSDTAWTKNGTPLCLADSAKQDLEIIPDGAGGILAAWADSRDAIPGQFTGPHVYAQRLTGTGSVAPGWPLYGVRVCTADSSQFIPKLVSDGAGGTFIAWIDKRTPDGHAYLQHVTSGGTIAPGWSSSGLALSSTSGWEESTRLIPDEAGGVIVVWDDSRHPSGGVYAQRITASGTVSVGWPINGLGVCTDSTSFAHGSKIAPDGSGGAFIAWQDARNASLDVYAQHLTSTGAIASGWTLDGIPLGTSVGGQFPADLIADGSGGSIVSFYHNVGFNWVLYAQRVTGVGAIAAGWPVDGVALTDLAVDLAGPRPVALAGDGSGGALATWNISTILGGASDVYVQHVTGLGAIASGWPASGLAVCMAPNWQIGPAILPDGSGGAFIAWPDARNSPDSYGTNADIYLQHITGAGGLASGWPIDGLAMCTISNRQFLAQLAPDGSDGAFVAWIDNRSLPPTGGVYAARVGGNGVVGTLLSLVSADAQPDRVRLQWFSSAGSSVIATLYRKSEGSDWKEIARLVPDGTGEILYEDRDVIPGSRVGYRLGVVEAGVENYFGEVWAEVPVGLRLSLAPPRPNPTDRDLFVTFSLPARAPAVLEVIDVAGRRVIARDLRGLEAGSHVVNLSYDAKLPAGIYTVRLRQASQAVTVRAAIIR